VLNNRVLVAEDNLLLASAICDLLVELGFEPVGPVSKVSQAFELLAKDAFDFVVMDVLLRDGNTFNLAYHLVCQEVPFLFITGLRREAIPIDLREVPMVRKPFEVALLQRALQTLGSQIASQRLATPIHLRQTADGTSCRSAFRNSIH